MGEAVGGRSSGVIVYDREGVLLINARPDPVSGTMLYSQHWRCRAELSCHPGEGYGGEGVVGESDTGTPSIILTYWAPIGAYSSCVRGSVSVSKRPPPIIYISPTHTPQEAANPYPTPTSYTGEHGEGGTVRCRAQEVLGRC